MRTSSWYSQFARTAAHYCGRPPTFVLALLVIVYLADKFHLRLRVFPVSQLAITVFVLLCLHVFILFWIDGIAGRNVPLAERWVPPFTSTLVWLALLFLFIRFLPMIAIFEMRQLLPQVERRPER